MYFFVVIILGSFLTALPYATFLSFQSFHPIETLGNVHHRIPDSFLNRSLYNSTYVREFNVFFGCLTEHFQNLSLSLIIQNYIPYLLAFSISSYSLSLFSDTHL